MGPIGGAELPALLWGAPIAAPPPHTAADCRLFFLQVERDFEREYGKLQQ